MQRDITIGKKRQLIDLNQDQVNFDLTVSVQAKDSDMPFQGVVVTQTDLDEGASFDYRNFVGAMRARLANDKGVYENHFLCLKTDGNEVPAKFVVEFGEVPSPKDELETVSEASDDEYVSPDQDPSFVPPSLSMTSNQTQVHLLSETLKVMRRRKIF